jgi:hypothetical protein
VGVLDKVKFWKHDDFALDIDKPAEQTTYEQPPSPYPSHAYPEQPHTDVVNGQGQYPGMQPDPMVGAQSTFGNSMQQPSTTQQNTFNHDVFAYQQYPQSTPFPGSAHQVQQEQFVEPVHDQAVHPRDVELILAKLDAIKSELDSLHQRVRKLEQIADNQVTQKNKYW